MLLVAHVKSLRIRVVSNNCVVCVTHVIGLDGSDGVVATVRSSAFNAAARSHRPVIERLRGHRHDAEGAVRLSQTQIRRPVSTLITTFGK